MTDQAPPVDNGLVTRRRWSVAARHARRGQSMVEFSMVIPLFILLVLAVFAFGLVFQNKIAMDNAVRDGARFASTQPDQWSNLPNPTQKYIQGQVQHSGGTAVILNQDPGSSSGQGISIDYFDPSGATRCGSYSYSANSGAGGFVPSGSSTEQSCLTPGNLVRTTATIKYQVPVPIVSAIVSKFFSGGLPITSSATMMLEQGCSGC